MEMILSLKIFVQAVMSSPWSMSTAIFSLDKRPRDFQNFIELVLKRRESSLTFLFSWFLNAILSSALHLLLYSLQSSLSTTRHQRLLQNFLSLCSLVSSNYQFLLNYFCQQLLINTQQQKMKYHFFLKNEKMSELAQRDYLQTSVALKGNEREIYQDLIIAH